MNKHSNSLGVLMLDLEGTELTEIEQDLLQRTSVGGLILFSRNYKTPSQLKQLIIAVRECREDILIAVDQEGGRVQRRGARDRNLVGWGVLRWGRGLWHEQRQGELRVWRE